MSATPRTLRFARNIGVETPDRQFTLPSFPPLPDPDPLERIRIHSAEALYAQPRIVSSSSSSLHISTKPLHVLDAPRLVDDFYLNVIAWSKSDIIAVALDREVWIPDSSDSTRHARRVCVAGGNSYITSLEWTPDHSHLAVGMNSGNVEVWDVEAGKLLRKFEGRKFVGGMGWKRDVLACGAADGVIWHHDVRMGQHRIRKLNGHRKKVCGLKWRPGDTGLLASGGDDNLVNVWDIRNVQTEGRREKPLWRWKDHGGTVKVRAPFLLDRTMC